MAANLWADNPLKDAFVRLGLTDVAAREFMENGVVTVHQLRSLSAEALTRLMKQLQRDNNGGAGIMIPFMSQEYIQAMRFWTNHQFSLGLPYDAEMFNLPDAVYWMEKMREQDEADEAQTDLIRAPEVFKKDTEWYAWSETVITYLRSKKGQNNQAPLAYVLRNHEVPTPDMLFSNDIDEKIGRTMLAGPQYAADNATVFDVIKSLASTGPLQPFVQPFERTRNGRGAWKALKQYYEGDSMNTRQKNAAYKAIQKANYQGPRRNFDFNTYVHIHQKAHQDLERYGEPVPELKKVRDFLEGITDSKCESIKLTVLASPLYKEDFNTMVNYVSGALDLVHRNNPPSTRQISEVSTHDSNSHGGRSGGGRGFYRGGGRVGYRGRRGGGRGRGRNLARSYSPEEWQALSAEERQRVYQARENRRGGGTGGRSRGGSVSGGRSRNTSAVISHVDPDDGNNTAGIDDVSALTNPTATRTVTDIGERMTRRQRIGAIYSSVRRIMQSRQRVTVPEIHTPSMCRAELDSHADTCGVNDTAYILEYTDRVVDVGPFSDEYSPMPEVPIVKAALAYDHPDTGETFILILGQALYFGQKLSNCLINPNQLRANGIIVNDIPQHLARRAGILSTHSIHCGNDSLNIPLLLKGIISYFNVRRPTLEEIHNCATIQLTDHDSEWDPYSPLFEAQEAATIANDMIPAPDAEDRVLYAMKTSPYLTEDIDLFDMSTKLHHVLEAKSIIAATQTSNRRLGVNAEELGKRWSIGKRVAEDTIKATTQSFIRSAIHPIERRYRTKNSTLRYNHLNSVFRADTMFSNVRSALGNTLAQVFVNDQGFSKVVPGQLKSEAGYALQELIQDVGIPKGIHTDDAKELTGGKWKEVCKSHGIAMSNTEPYSPWQNRAEGLIKEIKRHVRRLMSRTRSPKRLWDYCAVYVSDLRNRLALPLYQLHGRTPYEILTGNTPDISEYLEYEWYQPVWVHNPATFPEQQRVIGRWLGVAHRVGQAMCYWILPSSGIPIARSTIQSISRDELQTDAVKAALREYDAEIAIKLGESDDTALPKDLHIYLEDEEDDQIDNEPFEPEARTPNIDAFEADAYDALLLAEPLLPRGTNLEQARVIGRKRDRDTGDPVGHYNPNPLLNTRVYMVEFSDGHVAEYGANAIAEAIYNQVDGDGFQESLFQDIIGHHKDDEEAMSDDTFSNLAAGDKPHHARTTKGWEICIQWKDGTSSWHPLSEIKNSFPVHLAEYAVANSIQDEPAFKWWVKEAIKRRKYMLKAVKTRYARRTHKFGIQLPQTVDEALAIDRATKTTYWHDAIQKEMRNVKVAFKFLDPEERVPVGYKWIRCHLIFDVKMDFTRKARYVAGGHMTDPPSTLTYSSVVSRDSVRIAFLLAALNDIDLLTADIGNAYLNAPTREKVYTTAGLEFGAELQGRPVLIVRALYGLKSSGAAWRAHLASTLQSLNFTSSLADPDVWYRPAVKPDGFQYYEYLLAYVDDILVLSHEPVKIMKSLEDFYRLKDGYEKPTRYLGAEVIQWKFDDDITKIRWGLSSSQYVKEAIKNVEAELAKSDLRLPPKTSTPMPLNYRPELDTSPLLEDDAINYFQSQVSILRWAVELGRIDIYVDVAMLSQHLVHPRQGHLEAIYHIYSYLKRHERCTMVFDEAFVSFSEADFPVFDWTDFYGPVSETMPPNAPEPRGNPVEMTAFVDANHAGNQVTRRSHTGIIIYLNKAPVIWYSKAQATVETSTFGSEFVALRIATEQIEALRYKLRMIGVPILGPTNVLCDNKSVVDNSTLPHSTLKKKHNSICYHRVREAVAAKIIRIAHIPTGQNLADMLTKPLGGCKLHEFCKKILYHMG
jgi:hypothetical protein